MLCFIVACATGLAVLIALATSWAICDEVPASACETRSPLTAQLVVAVAGLVPVGLLIRAIWRLRGAQVAVWFIVAAVTYLLWGVLNDAAVHGWGNLKVFG